MARISHTCLMFIFNLIRDFADLPIEAEQEFVCRQRRGNFSAVCRPSHVKISAPVQCGSKIENRLLPAVSTSEFLPRLIGSFTKLPQDKMRIGG
jgi:hypothetical protein